MCLCQLLNLRKIQEGCLKLVNTNQANPFHPFSPFRLCWEGFPDVPAKIHVRRGTSFLSEGASVVLLEKLLSNLDET